MPAFKLKIKKGDTVKMLSGKDKGKTGKVLAVFPAQLKVLVENLNTHTRFVKSKSKNTRQPGSRVQLPSPIRVSKLQLIDPTSGKPTRVGFKIEGGVKQRISKKSKQPV